jgi:nucleotidyltransferase/DNA polymerase involved in DNA repair
LEVVLKMQLLCVHVPAFRLAVARRDRFDIAADEAAVLTDKADRGRVIELDPAAHALGARIGHTVLQARAAAGGVHVLVHDPLRSHAVWHDMLDALDAVSPLVDDTAEGTAYLDMRGIDGDAAEWIARAQRALQGFDLPVRAAVGPNKFVARALTYAPDGRIEALPIEVLELEPRAIERLHLLGVRALEDLAKLPHGPFVRRFGKAAAAWHERARGIDPTPFRPRAHELQIDAATYGEGSAEAEEQVIFALRVLADRVCGDLERAGRAAGQVCLTFECEDGEVREIEVGFAQATGEPRTMLDVMRAKLEGVTFGSPIVGLRLQALRLEECGAVATLFGQNEADPQALAVAFARLQAVTGSIPHYARTRPAARLEGRFLYDAFSQVTPHVTLSPSKGDHANTKKPVPQLRLLAVKEIDVKMRGNAPVHVQEKRVLNAAGPWRVDDGWFEPAGGVMRDEYDVLLEDGMLCRIYRQGEHWYLRGAYD